MHMACGHITATAVTSAGLVISQAKFDVAMAQKKALEDDAAATQRRMDSANALLSALAGEEGRWTQQSHEFNDTIQRLTGNPHSKLAFLLVCVSGVQIDAFSERTLANFTA